MTIGDGEVNRYIVINPGTRAFESRNPRALFVTLSRAKSIGKNNNDPDFAWHPSFWGMKTGYVILQIPQLQPQGTERS